MIRAFIILVLATTVISSCSKNKEVDDLAKAQQCLDEVPQGAYDQAYGCMSYVNEYNSQQANILKCSIVMTSGGLMEDKVIKAYNALKGQATNTTTAFMTVMALNHPSASGGYAKAKEADPFCQATGVTGFQYISGVVLAGSYFNQALDAISGNGIDITDQTTIDNAVNTILTNCGVAVPDPSCTNDLATLGGAVINLSQQYCGTADADENVCKQIQDAVTSAGGVPANVGQALFCYLNNKTYDSNTSQCTP